MKDYYKILGVDRNSSKDDIKKAFRKLAHKYHPDKEDGDEGKFKEASEAYSVLSNDKKRAQYDSGGNFDFNSSNVDFEEVFRGFSGAGGFNGNIEDVLRNIFGGLNKRGADIQMDVPIEFRESIYGVEKTIHVPYRKSTPKNISFTIPPGVESGSRLRLNGLGEMGDESDSPPGDLYILIKVKGGDGYLNKGGNLFYTLNLKLTEAILGAKKTIKDPKGGNLEIDVPEHTKDGDRIRIDGIGIPRPYGSGGLIVEFRIDYPTSISKKSKELFEKLKEEGL